MSYGKEERAGEGDASRTPSRCKVTVLPLGCSDTSLIILQMSTSWPFAYLGHLQGIQHMFAYGKLTSVLSGAPSRLKKPRVSLWPYRLSTSTSRTNLMPPLKNSLFRRIPMVIVRPTVHAWINISCSDILTSQSRFSQSDFGNRSSQSRSISSTGFDSILQRLGDTFLPEDKPCPSTPSTSPLSPESCTRWG
jgi:hypothetical protein